MGNYLDKVATIKPEEIFCGNIDDVIVTGFRQGDDHFIIQRKDLEASDFHIELNEQGQGCYDGLDEIVIQDDKIIFRLYFRGQVALRTDSLFIADLTNEKIEYKKIISELEFITRSLKL